MVETIELRVTSPKIELPGLDASIAALKEFKIVYDAVAKLPPIAVQGFQNVSGSVRQMSDYSKLMLQSFERLGQVDTTASMRKGFATLEEELAFIDLQMAKLRAYAAGAPPPGSPERLGNPKVDKGLSQVETAQSALSLRRQEITQGLPSDIRAQAMVEAEKNVEAASTSATTALRTQGQAVLAKAGQMGQLTGSLGQFTQAEREAAGATGQNVLLSEKYVTAKGKTELASRTFAEGVGVTRTELGKEGAKVIENTNFLEQYKSALRANSAEFANRRIAVGRGSAEEAQLLRAEAQAIQGITGSFGQFVGQAEQQRAAMRAAALERRANLIDAKGEQDLDQRRIRTIQQISQLEQQRTRNEATLQSFQARRDQFPESDTRKSTLPTGEVVKKETLSRQVEGLRETITLTSRFDANGKLINATLDETGRKMEKAFGGTTQNTLLATIGMAAKFIAIYRALDVVIRAFEFGTEAAVKFERQVATLSIIFHGTAEESHQLGIAALNMAANLGQIGTDAHEVAIEFARFGLRQAEVLEAMRVAMVGANVAQLELGESGKFLQAIYAGYNLQVGQLSGVLGGLDTVSHSYNVTNKQLLEGLSRVAPLAKQAGISLQELIGFEAAITGRTARPGAEAGTAIKTLISRLAKPTTQDALQNIAGVSVTGPSGDLKSASQVIGELYVAYQNLTRAEQQELLVKVAGAQQASRIAALLDGYLKSQELSIKASLDQGRAERENVAIRNTLASQLKTLQTEWQKFWIASAGRTGGFQSNITELVKGLSLVIDKFAELELQKGNAKPVKPVEQLNDQELRGQRLQGINALRRLIVPISPVGLPANPITSLVDLSRAAQADKQLDFQERQKKGAIGVADAERIAGEELVKFGQQLGKVQGEAQAFERTEATLRKIAQLLPKASVEKRPQYIESAARVVAPFDYARQLQIREELTNLAKLNQFNEIGARLSQYAADADTKRVGAVANLNKMLDQQSDTVSKAIELEKQRRDEAAHTGRGEDVQRSEHLIETYQQQLGKLAELRGQATQLALVPDEEEQFTADPMKVAERQKEAIDARSAGLSTLYKSITKPASEVAQIDQQIAEVEANLTALGRERVQLSQQIAGMTDRDRLARRQVVTDAIEAVQADQRKLKILREYADQQDVILQQQRQLKDAFEGIKSIFDAFPKFQLFGTGDASAVSEAKRNMSELLEKMREIQRQRGDTEIGFQQQFEQRTGAPGLIEPGNIDVTNRPVVPNQGGISTLRSISTEIDGDQILIPTVAADGSRILTTEEAIQQYLASGKHLGRFDTSEHADDYAQKLHEEQARIYQQLFAPPESGFVENLIPSRRSEFVTKEPPPIVVQNETAATDARQRQGLEGEAVSERDRSLRLSNGEADAQRSLLQIEKEKLDALRQYAELQDQISIGARQGRIESQQFRIGRNETEQLATEATGIQTRLLPDALNRIEGAGGDKFALGRAQAEAIELTNRLTNIQITLDERRFKIAADIANERRKETEEASKNLQLASREEQLRAALVARFVQNRGGRGFNENEFQFLDQDTRQSVLRFQPTAAPESVPTHARELEREQNELTKLFVQLSAAIEKTVKDIQTRVEGNQVTPGERRINAATVPGAINLPAINIDVRDQVAQLTRYLGDVVVSRFEFELQGVRDEVKGFINRQRINAAQGAATGAT